MISPADALPLPTCQVLTARAGAGQRRGSKHGAGAKNDYFAAVAARYAVAIEDHYGRPMDIEWGLDGLDGRLYILQARPETVKSRQAAGSVQRFRLLEQGELLIEGRAIGQRIGAGAVKVLTCRKPTRSYARRAAVL